jgi:anti-sigma B factor antagonist
MDRVIRSHEPGAAVGVLAVGGQLEAHRVQQVQQEFDQLLTAGARYIIMDLADSSFVDCGGLAVMVLGMKRCRRHNGELLLCGLCEPLRSMFAATHMDQALRIFDDELSARAAVVGA